jgi:DnaJ like chaperone protein
MNLSLNNDGQIDAKDELSFFTIVIVSVLLLVVLYMVFSILRDIIVHVIFKVPAFTDNYKFTSHNLRFAYKVAGCHMVVADLGNRKDQYLFLVSYLRRRFPKAEAIDLSALPRIYQLYPDFKEVVAWLEVHLDKSERLQFIDYLVDLAFYNSKLSSREMKTIYDAAQILGMSRNQIKSILTIRHKFYQEKEDRERKRRRENTRPKIAVKSKKKEALKILGIGKESANFNEVKKAYRTMAKKHHPDRFHNSGKREQEKANERFAIINQAYEYLEELLK